MLSNISKPFEIPRFTNLTQHRGAEFRRQIRCSDYRAWKLTPRTRLCCRGLSSSHRSSGFRTRCSSGASSSTAVKAEGEGKGGDEDAEAIQLFEKIRDAERARVEKLEDFENRANIQLERQIMMASGWSRALLTLRGKLKGTELDPEDSHKINYSEFLRLLDSNNVQYMEYSDFGQKVSVILPYKEEEKKGQETQIVYKRHIVDRMPVDCWNDVWHKLHQQLVNVDVINVKTVSKEVYSTVAITVIWSMRLFLAIGFYFWIDSIMRPIYKKPRIAAKMRTTTKYRRRELPKDSSLGSLGKSRAKFISAEETTGVTFDDFAGQEYIKEQLKQIVHILKNRKMYDEKGIYCPKGVLLHGPPGTGKTLLARAIAGEAGLPFFAANGTDFVEMFRGVAAARVRDLFNDARSYAPCIIFIDEIDAIGSKRGGSDKGGGGAEREQGLLQILTEMDGFKVSNKQVLVIGATNRADILDPALLRKGRFDRIVRVGLPSREGRLAILKVHARDKKFRTEEEKEALLQKVTEQTDNRSGAELQNILNEAAILTTRKDQEYITEVELMEAMNRQEGTFETGQEDKVKEPQEMILRTSYREAALAVLACYDPDPRRPFVWTHVATTRERPNIKFKRLQGRVFKKKSDYVRVIVRTCAPRVIEVEVFGIDNLCWISANAVSKAAGMAEDLILQSGMTAFGKAYYRHSKDIVPNLEAKLDALRDEYVRFGVETCTSVLREYREAVEIIAAMLRKKTSITAVEVWDIFNKSRRFPQPPVSPLDEYGALIYAGRWGIHGISCPGRVTFAPGYAGFATFGGPRPMATQYLRDDILDAVDEHVEKNLEAIKNEDHSVPEKKPVVLLASHFM